MRKFLFLILILLSLNLSAQTDSQPKGGVNEEPPVMADTMRSEGKIYVVVGVVTVLFAGFMIYLLATDKKIKNLEKEVSDLEEKLNNK